MHSELEFQIDSEKEACRDFVKCWQHFAIYYTAVVKSFSFSTLGKMALTQASCSWKSRNNTKELCNCQPGKMKEMALLQNSVCNAHLPNVAVNHEGGMGMPAWVGSGSGFFAWHEPSLGRGEKPGFFSFQQLYSTPNPLGGTMHNSQTQTTFPQCFLPISYFTRAQKSQHV